MAFALAMAEGGMGRFDGVGDRTAEAGPGVREARLRGDKGIVIGTCAEKA